jgi:hypothetical protein
MVRCDEEKLTKFRSLDFVKPHTTKMIPVRRFSEVGHRNLIGYTHHSLQTEQHTMGVPSSGSWQIQNVHLSFGCLSWAFWVTLIGVFAFPRPILDSFSISLIWSSLFRDLARDLIDFG